MTNRFRAGDPVAIRRTPEAAWERARYLSKSSARRAWHIVETQPDAVVPQTIDGYVGPHRIMVPGMRVAPISEISTP